MSTKKQRLKNPNIKIFIESSSYAEHNGEVVKDQYIREILDNNKMQVVEYDNGQLINYTTLITNKNSPKIKTISPLDKWNKLLTNKKNNRKTHKKNNRKTHKKNNRKTYKKNKNNKNK